MIAIIARLLISVGIMSAIAYAPALSPARVAATNSVVAVPAA